MSSVRILAPAKVNLGLAILGKRPDGYHEIDTIMAMIDLCDEIMISPSSHPGVSISGMDDVPVESNLMTKAARLWSETAGVEVVWKIDISKHIPSPAGIGGGSSDAAAVLLALNALHDNPLSEEQLHELASHIGADCPFFLQGPAARATGIGTDLRHIDPPEGWLVLAIPHVAEAAKTAKLYGALTPDDYGSRSDLDAIESEGVHSASISNSFLRPALAAFPNLEGVCRILTAVAGANWLSGAGPAIYALAPSHSVATGWADQIRQLVPADVNVLTAQFLQTKPQAELLP